jgi:hypothetical protein
MGAQVGILSGCQFASLDGLAYTGSGRNLKTWWNFEDFLHNSNVYNGIWTGYFGGAGASTGLWPISNTALRPGQVYCATGTTAAGWASYKTHGLGFLFGAGEYTFEADIYLALLSTAIEEFDCCLGFCDTDSANQVDGAYFRYDRAISGVNWQACTANNSVRTLTNTGVAAVTGWTRLKVVANLTGTVISYYINDILVATNTTDIPTAVGREFPAMMRILKSVGITARELYIDWAWLHFNLTASR